MTKLSTWRHCCVELTYELGHSEDASVKIHYMGGNHDFDIVAGTLADAFWLLEQQGWQLAAVTRWRKPQCGPHRARLTRRPVQTESYFFKRSESDSE